MKLSLKVLTSGKWAGKALPIAHFPFLIGRDSHCHLRPASEIISKRHCGLFIEEDGKLILRDFESTNGTFLNNRQLRGQIELMDGDRISLGVLEFAVQLENAQVSPRSGAIPSPASEREKNGSAKDPADTSVDELAATMLLASPDRADGNSTAPESDTYQVGKVDAELSRSLPSEPQAPRIFGDAAGKLSKRSAASEGETATRAKAILDQYVRRRRQHN
jgi:pSer/pThr/pTyr-binding forkhead associated (FHA) protein